MKKHKNYHIVVSYDYGYEYHPNSLEVTLSPERVIAIAKKGNADAIIMNRGMLYKNNDLIAQNKIRTILNFNSRNPINNEFHDIACIEDITALGVNGVNYKLFIGHDYSTIDSFNKLAGFLAGKDILLTGTVIIGEGQNTSATTIDSITYGLRVAAELGFDTFIISDVLDNQQLDKLLLEAYLPIWIGIRKIDGLEDLLEKVMNYREKGIAGIVVGKFFLSKFDSPKILEGIHKVFVNGKSVEEALKDIQTQ